MKSLIHMIRTRRNYTTGQTYREKLISNHIRTNSGPFTGTGTCRILVWASPEPYPQVPNLSNQSQTEKTTQSGGKGDDPDPNLIFWRLNLKIVLTGLLMFLASILVILVILLLGGPYVFYLETRENWRQPVQNFCLTFTFIVRFIREIGSFLFLWSFAFIYLNWAGPKEKRNKSGRKGDDPHPNLILWRICIVLSGLLAILLSGTVILLGGPYSFYMATRANWRQPVQNFCLTFRIIVRLIRASGSVVLRSFAFIYSSWAGPKEKRNKSGGKGDDPGSNLIS